MCLYVFARRLGTLWRLFVLMCWTPFVFRLLYQFDLAGMCAGLYTCVITSGFLCIGMHLDAALDFAV